MSFVSNDNIDTENDFDVNCEDTIYHERVKLCNYYQDRLENPKKYLDFTALPPRFVGVAMQTIHDYHVSQSLEENVDLVCSEEELGSM